MLQVKTQIAIVRSIKIFVKQLKLGKVNFPRAVDLLKLIREDRRILQTQISNYEQSCNQIDLKQLDVQGVYQELRSDQISNVEMEMMQQLNDFKAKYRIGYSEAQSEDGEAANSV